MNIAVYCASRFGDRPEYKEEAENIGFLIAKKGHSLVFGASDTGLMGAVANTVIDNGGKAIGVVPDIAEIKAVANKRLTETIFTPDLAHRRSKMIDLADAFITLPGGIGTLDEISEIMCLSHLNVKAGPIVVLNTLGYYDSLKEFIDKANSSGFLPKDRFGTWFFAENAEEAMKIIENFEKN